MLWTHTKYFNPSFVNSIEKNETYHGKFWLPQSTNDVLSGNLYLQKNGGITLKLIGTFQIDQSLDFGHHFSQHEVICGMLVPGGAPATLLNCKEWKWQGVNIQKGGADSVQEFILETIIMGCHLYKGFAKYSFSMTYLNDWLMPDLIKRERKGETLTLTATPIKEYTANYREAKITFTSGVREFADHFSERSEITIEFERSVTVEEFKQYQVPLIYLVQFASSLLNSITSSFAYIQVPLKTLRMISTSDFDRIESAKESVNHNFLFPFSEIQNSLQEFIDRWYTFYDSAGHIFKLYFDSRHISFQFPVGKFLNIIQAIESFHAFSTNKRTYHLATRISELMDHATSLVTAFDIDQDKFIRAAVNTRNYYTHYSFKLRSKAVTGLELTTMTQLLVILLNFHLMLECNIDKEKASEYVLESTTFNHVKDVVFYNSFWT